MKRLFYTIIGIAAVVAMMLIVVLSSSGELRIVRGTPKAPLNVGNYYDDVVEHRTKRMMVQPKDIIATGRTAPDVPPLVEPTFVSVDEALAQNFCTRISRFTAV